MNIADREALISLSSIIKNRIIKDGPMSFRDFMEWCLYYPGLGYYNGAKPRIGKTGDFYTSPYVHSIFGTLIAKQLVEMWQLMDRRPFTVVEYGAGTGLLCKDVLNYLQQHPDLYHQLTYAIIEKSEAMRNRQKMFVGDKPIWVDDIADITPVNGCVLSNELLDNFAVHQVVMQKELMEVMVGFNGKEFIEELVPASDILKNYFQEQRIHLQEGYRTEVNLQALEWINNIGQALQKGFVLTIDYGFPAYELYHSKRNTGNLVCYYQHMMNENPYQHIGEQDITVHVNFSALKNYGERNGLQFTGFTSQAHFLHGLGIVEELRKMEIAGPSDRNATRKNAFVVQSLLMNLGTKIRVLVQHKGIVSPKLSGLRFRLEI